MFIYHNFVARVLYVTVTIEFKLNESNLVLYRKALELSSTVLCLDGLEDAELVGGISE